MSTDGVLTEEEGVGSGLFPHYCNQGGLVSVCVEVVISRGGKCREALYDEAKDKDRTSPYIAFFNTLA